mmetsp:Transcript_45423/g.120847  ORF Transcript_45423/g.120847 Transcript_45423/m.120847 type:complete len:142 (+) Transcript_45423:56-481(+)
MNMKQGESEMENLENQSNLSLNDTIEQYVDEDDIYDAIEPPTERNKEKRSCPSRWSAFEDEPVRQISDDECEGGLFTTFIPSPKRRRKMGTGSANRDLGMVDDFQTESSHNSRKRDGSAKYARNPLFFLVCIECLISCIQI